MVSRTKVLGLAVGLIIVAACAVTAADARSKQSKRTKDTRGPAYSRTNQLPSLDGRITGRERTCGYDTYQYDGEGVPMGPYCH